MLPRLALSYPGDVARVNAKPLGDLLEAMPALFAQPPDLPHVALGQLGVAVPLTDVDAQDPGGVARVLTRRRELQVLRVIVPLVPVLVVYLHPFGNITVVDQVDDAMGIDVAAGQRQLELNVPSRRGRLCHHRARSFPHAYR